MDKQRVVQNNKESNLHWGRESDLGKVKPKFAMRKDRLKESINWLCIMG